MQVNSSITERLTTVVLHGLILGLLGGCTSGMSFGQVPDWMVPITLGDFEYSVPVPPGMREDCAGDPTRLAQRSAQIADSLTLLACLKTVRGAPTVLDGAVTVLVADGLKTPDFAAYKQALRGQVEALTTAMKNARQAGITPVVDRPRVLKILEEGKHWVVHAVARPDEAGNPRVGVVGSVLVRDRLFYLNLLQDGRAKPDWVALQTLAKDWAHTLIIKNEWRS
jgi:hypothetical protein